MSDEPFIHQYGALAAPVADLDPEIDRVDPEDVHELLQTVRALRARNAELLRENADLSEQVQEFQAGNGYDVAHEHGVLTAMKEIQKARARADVAWARLAELENAVTWMTSCTGCARMLDASYADHCRAEEADTARGWLRTRIRTLVRRRAELEADLREVNGQRADALRKASKEITRALAAEAAVQRVRAALDMYAACHCPPPGRYEHGEGDCPTSWCPLIASAAPSAPPARRPDPSTRTRRSVPRSATPGSPGTCQVRTR